MKKVLLGLALVFALASCTNHGKKLKIEGTKSEIYYKGDGVTEDDAKKTGEYLKKIGFLDAEREGSMQVSKDGDAYLLRFVYKKEVFDSMTNGEDNFKLIAADASKEIFNGKKVNIALADKHFKDFKTIPFDVSFVQKVETPDPTDPTTQQTITSKADLKHKAAADIDFYWVGISDDEANLISDYIVTNGSFSGGTAELYMTKENDRYIIRFPMIESARADQQYMDLLTTVTKQIKDNVFANLPFSFHVTDEKLMTVKSWDY